MPKKRRMLGDGGHPGELSRRSRKGKKDLLRSELNLKDIASLDPTKDIGDLLTARINSVALRKKVT